MHKDGSSFTFGSNTSGILDGSSVRAFCNQTGAWNNFPSADKQLELKNNFLKLFTSAINQIDNSEPGFRRKVFALHYGTVYVLYMTSHQFGKATKLASKYFFYSPYNFMLPMYHKVTSCLNIRFKRILRRK